MRPCCRITKQEYADYHRSVERDAIRLPADWAGRPLTLIEKTPSATLHAPRVGAQGAVDVTVSNGYGYVVFQVGALSPEAMPGTR